MADTPQTVDGPWPKNVPEGKQVNGFTGELEDAPVQDKSPSPLEQRLKAAGWDIRVDGGGDQFTKTGSFGGTSAPVSDDVQDNDQEEDTEEDDGFPVQPSGDN